MEPRDLRFLLSPKDCETDVTLSRENAAALLRRFEELLHGQEELLRREEELLHRQEELERENQRLRQEIERLRPTLDNAREKNAKLVDIADLLHRKLETLKNSLAVLGTDAKTAAAMGVPSSRTFFRRPPPAPEDRKKPGGQPGHRGTTRPRPTPNAPPRLLTLTTCPNCSHALGAPCDSWHRPVTELPAPRLEIFNLEVPRYKCPGCGERVHAEIPEAYRGEFGPRLKTYVAELRALGMPLDKVRELLRMTFGLEVSEASLLAMEEGVAERLDGTYRGLWEELHDVGRTPNAEGDETGFPVDGQTEQVWVGVSPTTTVYFTQHRHQVEDGPRSGPAAERFWGGYSGTLTHDGLPSYNAAKKAIHQAGLVHRNRELQQVEAKHGIEVRGLLSERPPKYTRAGRPPKEFLAFAREVRARWRREIRWVEAHPEASLRVRAHRYARALRSMDRLLARPWRDEDVVRVAGTLRQRRESLFTFVRLPTVPWSSNGAERELKVPVGIRKSQGGRKTERGTWVMDRVLTVWRTCRKRGLRFWDVVLDRLMGTDSGPGPSLPGPAG
ncbi:MAG: IS66 family transposase [Thermoplasmata archaeon]